ncbi:hypothetical protein CEUSTIGMA_g12795.t1, partial [Chlamydomonas eustigma]
PQSSPNIMLDLHRQAVTPQSSPNIMLDNPPVACPDYVRGKFRFISHDHSLHMLWQLSRLTRQPLASDAAAATAASRSPWQLHAVSLTPTQLATYTPAATPDKPLADAQTAAVLAGALAPALKKHASAAAAGSKLRHDRRGSTSAAVPTRTVPEEISGLGVAWACLVLEVLDGRPTQGQVAAMMHRIMEVSHCESHDLEEAADEYREEADTLDQQLDEDEGDQEEAALRAYKHPAAAGPLGTPTAPAAAIQTAELAMLEAIHTFRQERLLPGTELAGLWKAMLCSLAEMRCKISAEGTAVTLSLLSRLLPSACSQRREAARSARRHHRPHRVDMRELQNGIIEVNTRQGFGSFHTLWFSRPAHTSASLTLAALGRCCPPPPSTARAIAEATAREVVSVNRVKDLSPNSLDTLPRTEQELIYHPYRSYHRSMDLLLSLCLDGIVNPEASSSRSSRAHGRQSYPPLPEPSAAIALIHSSWRLGHMPEESWLLHLWDYLIQDHYSGQHRNRDGYHQATASMAQPAASAAAALTTSTKASGAGTRAAEGNHAPSAAGPYSPVCFLVASDMLALTEGAAGLGLLPPPVLVNEVAKGLLLLRNPASGFQLATILSSLVRLLGPGLMGMVNSSWLHAVLWRLLEAEPQPALQGLGSTAPGVSSTRARAPHTSCSSSEAGREGSWTEEPAASVAVGEQLDIVTVLEAMPEASLASLLSSVKTLMQMAGHSETSSSDHDVQPGGTADVWRTASSEDEILNQGSAAGQKLLLDPEWVSRALPCLVRKIQSLSPEYLGYVSLTLSVLFPSSHTVRGTTDLEEGIMLQQFYPGLPWESPEVLQRQQRLAAWEKQGVWRDEAKGPAKWYEGQLIASSLRQAGHTTPATSHASHVAFRGHTALSGNNLQGQSEELEDRLFGCGFAGGMQELDYPIEVACDIFFGWMNGLPSSMINRLPSSGSIELQEVSSHRDGHHDDNGHSKLGTAGTRHEENGRSKKKRTAESIQADAHTKGAWGTVAEGWQHVAEGWQHVDDVPPWQELQEAVLQAVGGHLSRVADDGG